MRCIYRIDINDRYYIGSTDNLKNRKRLHLIKLKKQYHPNKFLQNLYNKYGEELFIFTVIESVDGDIDLLKVEQTYLDEHFGKENCVNLSPIAGGGFYYIRTPEIIQKQLDSRRNNGNWYNAANPYPKEAIAANTGSKRSKEFCDKMSKWKRDEYKNNPDQLKKLRDASDKGRQNRWEQYDKPFILIKNNVEYGPYKKQKEVYESGLLSNLSISRLFLGKLQQVKGFSIKFINEDK